MSLSTAELLAVAVLKGDVSAMFPLCDAIMEEYDRPGDHLAPIKKVEVTDDISDVRVVLFLEDVGNLSYDIKTVEAGVKQWLRGELIALPLKNISRVELYKMSKPASKTVLTEEKLRQVLTEILVNYRGIMITESVGEKVDRIAPALLQKLSELK